MEINLGMFGIIMEFVGGDLVEGFIEAYPEIAPVFLTRIWETCCVVYVILLVMLLLMLYSVFRAFFGRA